MDNEDALILAHKTLYDARVTVQTESYYEGQKRYLHLVYYVQGYRKRMGLGERDSICAKGESWEECFEKLPIVLKV